MNMDEVIKGFGLQYEAEGLGPAVWTLIKTQKPAVVVEVLTELGFKPSFISVRRILRRVNVLMIYDVETRINWQLVESTEQEFDQTSPDDPLFPAIQREFLDALQEFTNHLKTLTFVWKTW